MLNGCGAVLNCPETVLRRAKTSRKRRTRDLAPKAKVGLSTSLPPSRYTAEQGVACHWGWCIMGRWHMSGGWSIIGVAMSLGGGASWGWHVSWGSTFHGWGGISLGGLTLVLIWLMAGRRGGIHWGELRIGLVEPEPWSAPILLRVFFKGSEVIMTPGKETAAFMNWIYLYQCCNLSCSDQQMTPH